MMTNTNHPMDTNVSVGATVSFRLYASSANEPMTRQWQHEGTNLPGATNATLVLTNVTAGPCRRLRGLDHERHRRLHQQPHGHPHGGSDLHQNHDGGDCHRCGRVSIRELGGLRQRWLCRSVCGQFRSSGSTRNTLYHNNGGTNFSRVAASPFTTDFMRAWSAAWADYDNDGNVDLIVANLDGGITAQRLYRNNGDGTFTAVVDAGLRSDTTRATCPWWIDYDNDGFLDLFMAKGMYLGGVANDCLFRNNGDGTFKKMTAAEVGPMLNDQWQSCACSSADYDNDGRQELAVCRTPGGSFRLHQSSPGAVRPTEPS